MGETSAHPPGGGSPPPGTYCRPEVLLLLALLALAAAAPADTARDLARVPDAVLTVSRTTSWAGGRLVRLEQFMHGLQVHGRPLTVSLPTLGEAKTYGRAVAEVARPAPRVDRSSALAIASGAASRLGRGELWPPRGELAWWAGGDEPALAWRVEVSTAAPPRTLRMFVHAVTGELVAGGVTSRSAQGNIYEISPSLGEVIEVELPGLTSNESLSGTYTRARSCIDWTIEDTIFGETTCHATTGQAVPDADGNYLYQPDPDGSPDPFAEVHTYFHVDRIARWMDERFGFSLGYPIATTVNFPMANAFFGDFDGDGEKDLSFGHVEDVGVDFAYDADVVYHEFGHAIVDRLAGDLPLVQADTYGMQWVSGSVHEGAADIWSMLLTGDPLTGEYAGSGFEREAIRDLEADRSCPGSLKGQVHADGELLGAFGWNLMSDPSIGPDITADLLYGAIPRWGSDLDWPSVGTSFLDSAAELLAASVIDGEVHDAIVAHLGATHMLDCGRVSPLDGGHRQTLFLMNGGLYEDLANIPGGVQLSLEVPPDATGVVFTVHEAGGSTDVGWVLYGRVGEPIEHKTVGVAALGLGFAAADAYDWRVQGSGVGEVRIGLQGELAAVPGETLYLSMASSNLGGVELLDFQSARVEVGAEAERAIEEVPGGCACAGGRAPSSVLAGLCVLVGLVRRRKEVLPATLVASTVASTTPDPS